MTTPFLKPGWYSAEQIETAIEEFFGHSIQAIKASDDCAQVLAALREMEPGENVGRPLACIVCGAAIKTDAVIWNPQLAVIPCKHDRALLRPEAKEPKT